MSLPHSGSESDADDRSPLAPTAEHQPAESPQPQTPTQDGPERRPTRTTAGSTKDHTTNSYSSSAPNSYSSPPSQPASLSQEITWCGLRVGFVNILLVSVAFCLLFSAFNTLQSYVTSLLPDGLGNISLAVIYSTVVCLVCFSPSIVTALGEPLAMTVGAGCYCLYMASLISLQPWLLLVCSVILGGGSSMLWVASGSYLTRCSEEHERGRNTGVFWAILQSSAVIGNLSAYFVFTLVTSTQLFITFCVVGCVGASVLLLLKPLPERYYSRTAGPSANSTSNGSGTGTAASAASSESSHKIDGLDEDDSDHERHSDESTRLRTSTSGTNISITLLPTLPLLATAVAPSLTPLQPEQALTISASIREVLQLFRHPPMAMLVPLFFFAGYEYAHWNGEFTQMLPKESIGLVLCCAGVMEVIGGTTLGPLRDRIGKAVTLVIGCCVYAVGLLLASRHLMFDSSAIQPAWADVRVYAYIAAGCFGFGDSAINTSIYGVLGQRYASRGTIPFTCFNLIGSIGMATGFASQLIAPMHGSTGTLAQTYLQVALLVAAPTGFIACERWWRQQKQLMPHGRLSSSIQ